MSRRSVLYLEIKPESPTMSTRPVASPSYESMTRADAPPGTTRLTHAPRSKPHSSIFSFAWLCVYPLTSHNFTRPTLRYLQCLPLDAHACISPFWEGRNRWNGFRLMIRVADTRGFRDVVVTAERIPKIVRSDTIYRERA